MIDCLIVGAGIAGGTVARKLAEAGKRVLMLERRGHPGGNAYDALDEHGIRVQQYGPHIFHTSDENVYTWVTRFCEPEPYQPTTAAVIDGISTPVPFNFRTIDQFYAPEAAALLKRALKERYPGRESVPVTELLESDDGGIRGFAEFLFEKDYRLYTAKQWNLKPEEVDPSVLKRVPVLLGYGGRYTDRWQFIPKGGFTAFYERMTDHPNIEIRLNTDALKHLATDEAAGEILFDGEAAPVVWTGAVDELFGYRFGVLPYRSLRFDFQSLAQESYQEAAVTAYPQAKGYTRITEYTKIPPQDGHGWTSIAIEYPIPFDPASGNERYYPVLTEESKALNEKYQEHARRFRNLTLCGRLAEFRYIEMDQAIGEILEGRYDTEI